jgi:MFS family permease
VPGWRGDRAFKKIGCPVKTVRPVRLFGVLAAPDYRRYLTGRAICLLGDQMAPLALAFAVLGLTRSAGDLSLVLASNAVAGLVFLPAGGVLADRLPRRRVMLWADAAQMLVTGALGVLIVAARPAIGLIAALGAAQGAADAVFQPAAAGLVPALVPPARLSEANTLVQVTGAATRVAAPAVAGILVAAAGPGWAILAGATSFAAGLVPLARLRTGHVPRPGRPAWVADLRAGWAAFRERTWLWATAAGMLAASFAFAATVVLAPVASVRYYDGAATWSTIMAVGAAGSVAGGLATARLRPRRPMVWALPGAACFGLTPLALAAGLPTAAVAVLAAAGETGLLVCTRLYLTAVQEALPQEVLSRVSAIDSLGSMAVFPLGLACAGPLAQAMNLRPALALSGLLMMLPALGLLVVPSVRNLKRPSYVYDGHMVV